MRKRNKNQFAGTGEGAALAGSFGPAAQVVILPGSAWRPTSLRHNDWYNPRPIAYREVSPP